MAQPNFKVEDVKLVAKAVCERWDWIDESGRNAYMCCRFCDATAAYSWNRPTDFKHEQQCPVLVSSDLLTGLT